MFDNKILSIAHMNIRSVNVSIDGFTRFEILQSLLIASSTMICSINESWLVGEDTPQTSSLSSWVGRNRSTRGGGVGILVHNSIAFSDITLQLCKDLNVSFEFCAILFVIYGRTVCFVSVYMPQTTRVNDFALLSERISIFGFDNVLFAGDWNSWHPAWGSPVSNARGEVLIDLFGKDHLNPTRMSQPTRSGDV